MSEENKNLSQNSVDMPEIEKFTFGSMLNNASPLMRRVVIYQGIILVVLFLVVVGSLAYKATLYMISSQPDQLEESVNDGNGGPSSPAKSEKALIGSGASDNLQTLPVAQSKDIKLLVTGEGTELAIRPEGAILISVTESNGRLLFHFRKNGRDYIRHFDQEKGQIQRYVIP